MLERIKIKVDEKKWESHPRIRIASKGELPEPAKVTPEMLKRHDLRMNKPFIPRRIAFCSQATADSLRHYVDGIGDTNPLYRDEEHAKKSRYGRIVSPSCYLYAISWGHGSGDGLTGIHGWWSGSQWEFYRPIYVGDTFEVIGVIRELVEKKGRMGGGRTWISYSDVIYVNQKGEIVAKERNWHTSAERAAAQSAAKHRGTPRPSYTREDWLKILELYDKEEIRSSVPRYWEDVRVGDKVGPMIKGPLAVRDELAWIIATGGSGQHWFHRAHKIQLDFERRHPGALEYVEEAGEADVPELVHVLDSFARTIGVERAYDYGDQRQSWLGNLFNNWQGDDGFLWKMWGEPRIFNQIGDLTIFEGVVTKKYIQEGKCCVDIEAWAENQRSEVSMPRRPSTVILPSREHGPAPYPKPAPELVEEVKAAKPLDDLIKEGLM